MNAELLDDPGSSAPAAPIALSPIERLLWRRSEAAAALAISERLLWSKTKTKEIPCIRCGKLVRYSPKALQEWIDRMSAES
jgi:hypothetical protein